MTAAGRAELRAGFNHQSAAPSLPQGAASEMVDTSALSTATGAAKPAISDVRAKLKDKGMKHGRS